MKYLLCGEGRNVWKGAFKPSKDRSLWAKDFIEQLHLFTEGAKASILQRDIEGLYLSIELHEGDEIITRIFFFSQREKSAIYQLEEEYENLLVSPFSLYCQLGSVPRVGVSLVDHTRGLVLSEEPGHSLAPVFTDDRFVVAGFLFEVMFQRLCFGCF